MRDLSYIRTEDLARYRWKCERCQHIAPDQYVHFAHVEGGDGAVFALCNSCGLPCLAVRVMFEREQTLTVADVNELPF